MVPPFDHEWIIEGQGTCGLEILEQVPDVDVVVVPVGGGGLAAGVSSAIKLSRSDVEVVAVEPSWRREDDGITRGWPSDHVGSDGDHRRRSDAGPPGDLTFEHVQRFVDRMVTVDDVRIAEAALWLFFEAKQVVEPSGAASVAAVLWPEQGSPLADRGKKVVAILSGGNVAPQTLAALMQ